MHATYAVVSTLQGCTTQSSMMRSILIAAFLLFCSSSEAVAGIFTVKPGTIFYSKANGNETNQLQLPEVRVRIPPLQDSRGFCRFKLVYKIADQNNPAFPDTAWARCVSIDTSVQLLKAK